MLKRLFNWLLGLIKHDDLYKYKFVDDVPESISSGKIYIVGNKGYHWQGVMLCPCGCKEHLYINFIEEQHPCWTYKIGGEKKITLHPSLWRKTGCKSHFFVKKGKVVWV
ncbi:MAG: hypothetical protein H7296_08075 [Bacteroidia bacterium]|nr:hypothetical protein [Bacteroidia bacterium]